jgi:hypothetical protein
VGDWRAIDAPAATQLLTRLRALSGPWAKEDAPALLERLGFAVTSKDENGVTASLRPPLEGDEAEALFHEDGIDQIEVAVTEHTGPPSPASRLFLNNVFAELVELGTDLFGPPTRRLPGEYPHVEWRDEVRTLFVRRLSVTVTVTVMPTGRREYWDSLADGDG